MVLDRVLNGIMPDRADPGKVIAEQKVIKIERYLTCFACFRFLKQTVDAKNWRYPHAAYAKEHDMFSSAFGVSFVYSKELDADFNRVYEFFANLSVFDFFEKYINDWPEAKRVAEQIKVYTNENVTDIGICMTLVLLWREIAGLPNAQPYMADYKKRISEDQWKFLSLLGTPGTVPLEYKSEVHASSRDALKILTDIGFSIEDQLQVYQMIREEIVGSYHYVKKNAWKCKADHPWKYLRRLHGKNPRIDMLGWNDMLDSAAIAIAKIKLPTDYLTAIYNLYHLDDSDLEHDFVLPIFVGQLSEEDRILVVNPAPTFLKYYPEEQIRSTVFCVPIEEMAAILREEFPTMLFSTYDSLTLTDEFGASKKFTKMLAFFRGSSKGNNASLFEDLYKIASKNCKLYALLPSDHVVNSSKDTLYAFDRFHIETVDIVKSANPYSSKPVHKAFVMAHSDYRSANVAICKHELVHGTKKMPSLLMEKGRVSCPAEALKTELSLNKLYAYLEKQPPERNRSKPGCYRFTPEIFFWYKTSLVQTQKLKVEAYVSHYATSTQVRRNTMARGKRINESYCSVTVPQEMKLEEWLENKLPYSSSIHAGAVKAYEQAKRDGLKDYPLLQNGICLKTLWYLCLTIPEGEKNYRPAKEEQDMFSSCVGSVRVTELESEDGAAIIKDAMGGFQAKTGTEDMLPYWARLGHLLADARRSGFINRNPVEAILENEQEKRSKKNLANLKNALAKRSFRIDEERQLFKTLLLNEGNRPEDLAVAIRLFTGVEANIVSALTWGDIYHIPEIGIDQFRIYRQTDNAALKIHPFDSLSSYRRIPISPTLKLALDARKRYLVTNLHVKNLKALQIVASDQYIQDEKKPQIAPRTINKWSQKAVQRIGIEDNCISTADEYGVIETNLSDYHGDIFRSNFKYRVNYTCGFTDAEACYILGLRQSTPFGKNYCDFTNDFAQFMIYQKLCRWEAMLAAAPMEITKYECSLESLSISNVGGAEIQVPMEANKAIDFSIRCRSGISGDILLCREEVHEYG